MASEETARAIGLRIAILGLHLEANRFAPLTTRADFLAECWLEGEAISQEARRISHAPPELNGFYQQMDRTGPWEPVPLILLAAQPGGPIEQPVFDEMVTVAVARLRTSGPVDAVYICSHGGSLATADLDNDGTLAVRIRDCVGPDVPIVVTHDLHCNVSERMVDAIDALVTYRTNPHVDHRACGAEAADLVRRLAAPGAAKTAKAFVKVPIVPWPATTMLTDSGPYADLVRMGLELQHPPILSIAVTAGFVLSDLPKCGLAITVTTQDDQAAADRAARVIAEAAWADRHRYVADLLSLDAAVALARAAGAGEAPPLILADVADNPGGGGLGNTTSLLAALHEAGIPGVYLGLFTDPALADTAHAAGMGAHVEAVFASNGAGFSRPYPVPVTVEALHDGHVIGRRGRDAGRAILLGKSALLRLDGSALRVIVTSLREQPADPATFEMMGIDLSAARVVVVKSCAHFWAGFDEFFPPHRIFEVDVPGLTSNVLANFDFRGLPRPVWPLDAETTWRPALPLPPAKATP